MVSMLLGSSKLAIRKGSGLVIAVDGPAAAGKGTLSKRLAISFKLLHLDTGLLYRGVGLKALQQGVPLDNENLVARFCSTLQQSDLAHPDIRTEIAGAAASKVSALPSVRAALLQYQRDLAYHPPKGFLGSVLDGRDIGTVVCPHANAKFFITASAQARAARRTLEIKDTNYDEVLKQILERDARDSSRSSAPLVPAADALVIDTSKLTAEQVYDIALQYLVKVGCLEETS